MVSQIHRTLNREKHGATRQESVPHARTATTPLARRRGPARLTGPGAEDIARIAGGVPDPELPMLSLANLGIMRAVDVDPETGAVTVTITPTYSGCPAMDAMADDIVTDLKAAGYQDVTVRKVLGGDWSSDDVTAEGREQLRQAGIAPPPEAADRAATQNANAAARTAASSAARKEPAVVPCPLCESGRTEQLTPFGSTSCKALYRCLDCREPFEYFKAH